MLTAPYEKQQLGNFDILERLAAAWNPPDVSGTVYLIEGMKPDTLHICFTGLSGGRQITTFGTPIDLEFFRSPAYRKVLARAVRDHFTYALGAPSGVEREVGFRKVECL